MTTTRVSTTTDSLETGVVLAFSGDHAFLSNFHQTVFEWRGKKWFCGEQAFQWAKTLYPAYGEGLRAKDLGMRLADTGNPSTAKKYGRQIPLDVKAWDERRVWIMREIVHAKFGTGKGLAGQLINTGAKMLIEGNDWGDTFWGRTYNDKTGKWTGLNTLGVILMEERGFWIHDSLK